jgi:hypothetical protein
LSPRFSFSIGPRQGQEAGMEIDSILILMLISFIIGMVMGISLVRPGRSA